MKRSLKAQQSLEALELPVWAEISHGTKPRQQPIQAQAQKPTLRSQAGFQMGPLLFSHILLHPSPRLCSGEAAEQTATLQEVENHHKKIWFGKGKRRVPSTDAEV